MGGCRWGSHGLKFSMSEQSGCFFSNCNLLIPALPALRHQGKERSVITTQGTGNLSSAASPVKQAPRSLGVSFLPNRDGMPGSCCTQSTYSVGEQSWSTGHTLRPLLIPPVWLRQDQLQREASLNLQCLLGSQTHPLQLLMPRSPLLEPDPSVSCMPHI